MFDEDGSLLETSEHDGPLVYRHGTGELPQGLEDELEGKRPGDKRNITLGPKDAYGEYDSNRVTTLTRDSFDVAGDIEVGMYFETDENGSQVVRVVDVEGGNIVVDANEPYAGRSVRFEVEVLGVRPLQADDVSSSNRLLPSAHLKNDRLCARDFNFTVAKWPNCVAEKQPERGNATSQEGGFARRFDQTAPSRVP